MKKQENMEFIEQSIPGVFVIEPKKFGDARGYFMETYRQDLFERHVGKVDFAKSMLLKEYDLYNSTESFPIVYVGIDSIKMFDLVSSLSVPFELTR